ncbi:ParB/RepB/Spo0J family partition protein (plasmid) [Cupriavidus pinatubonensis]|uniref:ParB/RepB/Spo0J family partition protein n=1 Tax=Cupriavidus pinatubonensis TaxID=248026 RepID=UPI001C736B9B|nr:ParB/RepB/Spo0J family partition protein [Cupriavidus pinatubonensis]QYY33553.1 ParB/RepB/Spo0J family partition protein [Cupriavidus pinatubonensis]
MSKQNSVKKKPAATGLSLAAGLLKGLNNEQAALDERERADAETPPHSATVAPIRAVHDSPPVTKTGPSISPASGGRLRIAVADCISNPYNPREFYPEAKIQELAVTLKRDGQIETIKVTQLPKYPGKYVVIDGERRLRATKSLGEALIDAELRADQAPAELYSTAYRANNDHERQTIFDDAIAWRRLLDDAVFADQNALAERVGRDKTYVSKVLSLNSLPRSILERMAESASQIGLQAAYFIKLIFDKVGEDVADRTLSAVIDGKKTVRQLELQVRDLADTSAPNKKARTRYHQLYDFKVNGGGSLGQLKTFPDGRVSLELVDIPTEHQEALAEKLKAIVDSFSSERAEVEQ